MSWAIVLAVPLMLLAGSLLDIATNDDSEAEPDPEPQAVNDTPEDQEPII